MHDIRQLSQCSFCRWLCSSSLWLLISRRCHVLWDIHNENEDILLQGDILQAPHLMLLDAYLEPDELLAKTSQRFQDLVFRFDNCWP